MDRFNTSQPVESGADLLSAWLVDTLDDETLVFLMDKADNEADELARAGNNASRFEADLETLAETIRNSLGK